jgi:hypothetical protein
MSPNLILTKESMGRSLSPRVVCAVTLALVFLCGAAAGALAMKMGSQILAGRGKVGTPSGKNVFMEQMKKDLDLTPAQVTHLESVLDDFNTYYRTVLADAKSRIMEALTEPQKQKFLRLLEAQRHP